MNEFELIARLTQSLPTNEKVVTGAGDDCAVLDLGVPDKLILFKTDAVVEGIHFTGETPPEKIGHKALARCLSKDRRARWASIGDVRWALENRMSAALPSHDRTSL